ncbi:hypothetical protein [Streptomyces sp. NPDC005955]|uniref:hypothetical protein n=1 Tax=Streptomyces sp. NPDC005955 TaxID=3364738 RepID=UPI0036A5091F
MRTRPRRPGRFHPDHRVLAFTGVLAVGAVLLALDVPSDWFTVIGLALACVAGRSPAPGRRAGRPRREAGRKRRDDRRRHTR